MEKINIGNKPFTIAFSGGCFSGKTSTMKALKSTLEKEGNEVIILSELIRETEKAKRINSIDEIRRCPNMYFDLQKDIIRAKVQQEFKAFFSNRPVIYLFDRALTDSLFYYEFYVDKSNLCNKQNYFAFYEQLICNIKNSFNYLDLIVEFKPLKQIKNDDMMRPATIEYSAQAEYLGIHRNNMAFLKSPDNYMQLDLSSVSGNNSIEQIINKIKKICLEQQR